MELLLRDERLKKVFFLIIEELRFIEFKCEKKVLCVQYKCPICTIKYTMKYFQISLREIPFLLRIVTLFVQ